MPPEDLPGTLSAYSRIARRRLHRLDRSRNVPRADSGRILDYRSDLFGKSPDPETADTAGVDR